MNKYELIEFSLIIFSLEDQIDTTLTSTGTNNTDNTEEEIFDENGD